MEAADRLGAWHSRARRRLRISAPAHRLPPPAPFGDTWCHDQRGVVVHLEASWRYLSRAWRASPATSSWSCHRCQAERHSARVPRTVRLCLQVAARKTAEDSTGTDASQTMRTNHWNILICFQLKINARSLSSKRSEKNAYTTEETHALEDAFQADSLLQRAECHAIQAEREQHDA